MLSSPLKDSPVIEFIIFSALLDWKNEPYPKDAAKHATGRPVRLAMDLADSAEDRERANPSFL